MADLYALQDPTKQYPVPKFKHQPQRSLLSTSYVPFPVTAFVQRHLNYGFPKCSLSSKSTICTSAQTPARPGLRIALLTLKRHETNYMHLSGI